MDGLVNILNGIPIQKEEATEEEKEIDATLEVDLFEEDDVSTPNTEDSLDRFPSHSTIFGNLWKLIIKATSTEMNTLMNLKNG